MVGQTISHYKVLEKIGKGDSGSVTVKGLPQKGEGMSYSEFNVVLNWFEELKHLVPTE